MQNRLRFTDIDVVQSTIVSANGVKVQGEKYEQKDDLANIAPKKDLIQSDITVFHSGAISDNNGTSKQLEQSIDPFEEYEKAFPKESANPLIFSDVPLMESGFKKKIEIVPKQQQSYEENKSQEKDFVVIENDYGIDHRSKYQIKEDTLRLDAMSSKIDSVLEMMKNIELRLIQVEITGESLVSEMNDTRAKVRAHQEIMETTTRRLDQLESSQKVLQDAKLQTEANLQETGHRLADLDKRVNAGVSSVENVEENIKDVTKRLETVEQARNESKSINQGSLMETSHVRGMTKKLLENDDRLDLVAEYLNSTKQDIERFDQSQKDIIARLDELCTVQERKNRNMEDQIRGGYIELQDNIKEHQKTIKTCLENSEKNSIQINLIEEEMSKIKAKEPKQLIPKEQPTQIKRLHPTFEQPNNLCLKLINENKTIDTHAGALITAAIFAKQPLPKKGQYSFNIHLGSIFREQSSYVFVGVAVPSFKQSQLVFESNCYFLNPLNKIAYLNSEDVYYQGDELKPEDLISVEINFDDYMIRFKVNEVAVASGPINIGALGQTDLYPCVYFERCRDFKVSFL